MSIILDALKKMEGEGAAKGSREILPPPKRPLSGRKRGLLLSLAAAALALNLFAVVLWLGEKNGGDEGSAGENVRQPVAKGLAAAPVGMAHLSAVPEVARPVAVPAPVGPGAGAAEKSKEEAPLISPEPLPAVEKPVAASPLPPATQEIAALGEGAETESVNAVEGKKAYDGSVLFVEDLPADLRSGVEDLKISAHVYSDDPSFRRVAVNDSLRREGDAVAADLVVEEITERGAVFNYRGYRFRMESR